MASEDIALMAHLMRRAGFGATREELEERAAKGYAATVEELLNPETVTGADRYEFLRYHPSFWKPITSPGMGASAGFTLCSTPSGCWKKRWCCSGTRFSPPAAPRLDHWHEMVTQIDLFRQRGMGSYRDLLVELSRNPAMISAGQLRQPRRCGQ